MGLPISPLCADIVMDNLDNNCLRILKDEYNCSPLFYYRFLDDTFLRVQNKINWNSTMNLIGILDYVSEYRK